MYSGVHATVTFITIQIFDKKILLHLSKRDLVVERQFSLYFERFFC